MVCDCCGVLFERWYLDIEELQTHVVLGILSWLGVVGLKRTSNQKFSLGLLLTLMAYTSSSSASQALSNVGTQVGWSL